MLRYTSPIPLICIASDLLKGVAPTVCSASICTFLRHLSPAVYHLLKICSGIYTQLPPIIIYLKIHPLQSPTSYRYLAS